VDKIQTRFSAQNRSFDCVTLPWLIETINAFLLRRVPKFPATLAWGLSGRVGFVGEMLLDRA